MHHYNHFYGHAHILARYCGLDPRNPPRIHGVVQHGWTSSDGLLGTPIVPAWLKFVWSDGPRRRGPELGRRHYFVTGAPWNYLLAMEPEPKNAPPREGTIWYPFHGSEFQEVLGDHRRLIDQIRATETGPVTVCLYWREHSNAAVRRMYEDAGFRVICHGYRGFRWRNTDSRFLYRQLAELRRHRRVASNRMSTAILYGVSVGCEPAVFGDPMVLQAEPFVYGGIDRTRRLWPEMNGVEIDLETARRITDAELGTRYLATPEEIRVLFGWPEGNGHR